MPDTIRRNAPRVLGFVHDAGGFEYKAVAFYWVKLNSVAKHHSDSFTGLGYWTSARQTSP
jgi:hypothetical protein